MARKRNTTPPTSRPRRTGKTEAPVPLTQNQTQAPSTLALAMTVNRWLALAGPACSWRLLADGRN